ncbi:hypothetical protein C8R43DRAFT_322035 [Mycena crocata]|nr:hypothetical protein C8R43DRAFT_322035 [Mycena crocata]
MMTRAPTPLQAWNSGRRELTSTSHSNPLLHHPPLHANSALPIICLCCSREYSQIPPRHPPASSPSAPRQVGPSQRRILLITAASYPLLHAMSLLPTACLWCSGEYSQIPAASRSRSRSSHSQSHLSLYSAPSNVHATDFYSMGDTGKYVGMGGQTQESKSRQMPHRAVIARPFVRYVGG